MQARLPQTKEDFVIEAICMLRKSQENKSMTAFQCFIQQLSWEQLQKYRKSFNKVIILGRVQSGFDLTAKSEFFLSDSVV